MWGRAHPYLPRSVQQDVTAFSHIQMINVFTRTQVRSRTSGGAGGGVTRLTPLGSIPHAPSVVTGGSSVLLANQLVRVFSTAWAPGTALMMAPQKLAKRSGTGRFAAAA